jgi:autotransporter-associated beta strand protein
MTTLHLRKPLYRSSLRLGFLFVPLAVACSVFSPTAQAGSATWRLSPASGDWNTATNWNPATAPNGSSDVAGFSSSNRLAISISQGTTVERITFNSNASAFTISSSPGLNLDLVGAGIVNNSGKTQNFVNNADSTSRGEIRFFGTASAGVSTVFTNNGRASNLFAVSGGRCHFFESSTAGNGVFIQNGGTGSGGDGGRCFFVDTTTAGNATFTNNGGVSGAGSGGVVTFNGTATAGSAVFTNNGATASDAPAGFTQFDESPTGGDATFTNNGGTASGAPGAGTGFFTGSSAGNATLIANGGSNGGGGGDIDFEGDSAGGTSRIKLFGNGFLELSFHNAPGVTVGSIEGDGDVFLGAINLAVGSNNRSTIFSGVIQDGGLNGGSGGSFTKIGNGKLTLSDASTYTGGTTINKGMLLVKNTIGSATGTGAVQVNAGTLEGVGRIAGPVTVGTGVGTTSKANLLAGNSNTSPGTLTISNPVTFQSDSTYKCVLNRSSRIASKLTASGVTINNNAQFAFIETGTGTLATGTVFRVIDNTSNLPISGRFRNLSNGLVLTSPDGTKFKVNYAGGTGNDLTLKVVP